MDYAERLNNIIEVVGKSYDNVGYNRFDNQSDLKALQNANAFFTTSVLGMKAISHVIEDQAINLNKPFQFYSAFQKLSRFKAQEERYRRILATKNPVYIFGIPDTRLWSDPNLIEIPLEESVSPGKPSLANNWFVVLNNPHLVSMALVSREIPANLRPTGAPDKLVYRNFEGFWTYDKEAIARIVEVLQGYIKQRLGK
jgi:DICT domain-containing protein